jgi:hypothetical protein
LVQRAHDGSSLLHLRFRVLQLKQTCGAKLVLSPILYVFMFEEKEMSVDSEVGLQED